jgi:DegV family protein with EDD domain
MPEVLPSDEQIHVHSRKDAIEYRYCTEALITGHKMDVDGIREEVRPFGNSAIVAGSPQKVKIHIHTNSPADLFYRLRNYGSIPQIKADDMWKQYEASHNRKSKIALVTDSSCDLPPEVIDDHQIHVIPFNLSFGDSIYLDKISITPQQFYTLLRTSKMHPRSSLPPLKTAQSIFSFVASHYESIIAITISEKLSGTFRMTQNASSVVKDKRIDILNSRHLSVSQGLIVLRVAEAIREGKTHDGIMKLVEDWISKTDVFVDIKTLKYMVRGGRVSPLKGMAARLLNIKPLIHIDKEGKAAALGKSFTRRGNVKKIIKRITNMAAEGKIWNYAIVHAQNLERAEMYAGLLEKAIQKKPAYIMDVSPVIGVHNGIGVVGIGVMYQ